MLCLKVFSIITQVLNLQSRIEIFHYYLFKYIHFLQFLDIKIGPFGTDLTYQWLQFATKGNIPLSLEQKEVTVIIFHEISW